MFFFEDHEMLGRIKAKQNKNENLQIKEIIDVSSQGILNEGESIPNASFY